MGTLKLPMISHRIQPVFFPAFCGDEFDSFAEMETQHQDDHYINIEQYRFPNILLCRGDGCGLTSIVLFYESLRARESGSLGWAQVALYYSSYHAFQALLSLHGHVFVRTKNKNGESSGFLGIQKTPNSTSTPPKVRLIKGIGKTGHNRLWAAYDMTLQSLPESLKYSSLKGRPDVESKDRNIVNYDPEVFVNYLEKRRMPKSILHVRNNLKDEKLHTTQVEYPTGKNIEQRNLARIKVWLALRKNIDSYFRPTQEVLEREIDFPDPIETFLASMEVGPLCKHNPLSDLNCF